MISPKLFTVYIFLELYSNASFMSLQFKEAIAIRAARRIRLLMFRRFDVVDLVWG